MPITFLSVIFWFPFSSTFSRGLRDVIASCSLHTTGTRQNVFLGLRVAVQRTRTVVINLEEKLQILCKYDDFCDKEQLHKKNKK